MTDTSAAFPALGFDPLPGDPEVARALSDDAAEFGRRMTQEAERLRNLAHQGWQGEAADVFSQHLETLPRDLERCGEAFSDMAVELTKYHTAFVAAKAEAKVLEERAAAAKQTLQQAEFTYSAPVMQAPAECPPVRDRGPLNDAEDSYGAILREAHGFAEQFNERCEIQAVAAAIRNCTRFAPDEPGWGIVRRWAGTVFRATPIGTAVGGIHDLINEYGEFFNDLAGLLSDLSGTLGLLSVPLLFLPPIGTAVAVGALATAAGSAAIKTSLYVGHARDANGTLYVSGGSLIRSYVDVGVNAAGIGAGAAVGRAGKLAEGVQTTFGQEVAGQFTGKVFREAIGHPKELVALGREMGPKAAAKLIAKDSIRGAAELPGAGKFWTVTGVGLTGGGPLLTATKPDSRNFFGWHSAQHLLLDDFPNLLTDAPNSPDLQLRVPPRITAPAPSPVMER